MNDQFAPFSCTVTSNGTMVEPPGLKVKPVPVMAKRYVVPSPSFVGALVVDSVSVTPAGSPDSVNSVARSVTDAGSISNPDGAAGSVTSMNVVLVTLTVRLPGAYEVFLNDQVLGRN